MEEEILVTSPEDTSHRDEPDVASWLATFFETLEDRGYRYAALRVDRSLFSAGNELDLLVHPRSIRRILDEIRNTATNFGLRIARWVEFPGHSANVILAWNAADGLQHYRFDVRTGIRKHGHLLLDGRPLGNETTTWDPELSVRRLRDDVECALIVIRNHLDGREPNERHNRILRERGRDNEMVEAASSLGWSLTGSSGTVWNVQPVRNHGGTSLRLVTLFGYALRALRGRIGHKGFGMNIILYGPDGVGKSTQAEHLADSLRHIGIRDVHLYHHLVQVQALPEHSRTKRYEAKARVYRAAPRSWAVPGVAFVSYMKKLLYMIRYVRPALRRGESFVHDRYLLDVFQKLQRTRGVRVPLLERVLPYLSPREDFVIVLSAPPNIISERTGELTEGQVREAYELLDRCLSSQRPGWRPWVEVDASKSAEQVHFDLLDQILAIQDARIRRER